tara:strand:- start:118 stop:294 length:177 start_codon:yes stop_codon:yes gene_type:complete
MTRQFLLTAQWSGGQKVCVSTKVERKLFYKKKGKGKIDENDNRDKMREWKVKTTVASG